MIMLFLSLIRMFHEIGGVLVCPSLGHLPPSTTNHPWGYGSSVR